MAVALVTYATLVVIGVSLDWEPADRFLHPRRIEGGLVTAVAVSWAWRSTPSSRHSSTV